MVLHFCCFSNLKTTFCKHHTEYFRIKEEIPMQMRKEMAMQHIVLS